MSMKRELSRLLRWVYAALQDGNHQAWLVKQSDLKQRRVAQGGSALSLDIDPELPEELYRKRVLLYARTMVK